MNKKKSSKFSRLQLRSKQSNIVRIKQNEVISRYFQTKSPIKNTESEESPVAVSEEDTVNGNEDSIADKKLSPNFIGSRIESEIDTKTSLRNIHYSDDETAFKSPEPVRRKIVDLIAESRNENTNKKVKKKCKSNRGRKQTTDRSQTDIRRNFMLIRNDTEINEDHFQLAIALSKSLADQHPREKTYFGESDSSYSQEEIYPSTQEKITRARKTLEEFGFKPSRTKTHVENYKIPITEKLKRKQFKFGNITPTLLRRTDKDRREKIAQKVSLILDENVKERIVSDFYNDSIGNIHSFYLEEYVCSENLLFFKAALDVENTKSLSYFYTNSIVREASAKVGSLLRDWDSIPGREKTPPRSENPKIDSTEENNGDGKQCNNLQQTAVREIDNGNQEIFTLQQKTDEIIESTVDTEIDFEISSNKKSVNENGTNRYLTSLKNTTDNSKKRGSQRFSAKCKSEYFSSETKTNMDNKRNSKCRKSLSFDDRMKKTDLDSDENSCSLLNSFKPFGYRKSLPKLNTEKLNESNFVGKNDNLDARCVSPDLFSDLDDGDISIRNSVVVDNLIGASTVNKPIEQKTNDGELKERFKLALCETDVCDLTQSPDESEEKAEDRQSVDGTAVNSKTQNVYDLTQSSNESENVLSGQSLEYDYNDRSHNLSFYASVKDSDSDDSFNLPEVFINKKRSVDKNDSDADKIFTDKTVKTPRETVSLKLDLTQSDSENSDVCIISDEELNYSCSTPYYKRQKASSCSENENVNVKNECLDRNGLSSDLDKITSSDKTLKISESLGKKNDHGKGSSSILLNSANEMRDNELPSGFTSFNFDVTVSFDGELKRDGNDTSILSVCKNSKVHKNGGSSVSSSNRRTVSLNDDLKIDGEWKKSETANGLICEPEQNVLRSLSKFEERDFSKFCSTPINANKTKTLNDNSTDGKSLSGRQKEADDCISVRMDVDERVNLLDEAEERATSQSSSTSNETVKLLQSDRDTTPKLLLDEILNRKKSRLNVNEAQSVSRDSPRKLLSPDESMELENQTFSEKRDYFENESNDAIYDDFHTELNLTRENKNDVNYMNDEHLDALRCADNFVVTNSPIIDRLKNEDFADRMKYVTPHKEVIVKTDSVTPMADYDSMATPEVHKELKKFGLKPLKRTRGTQILKYIYNATHPVYEDFENDESAEENVCKKRKLVHIENKSLQNKMTNEMCQNKNEVQENSNGKVDIVGDLLPEDYSIDELIFERKRSKRIASCQLPLHIAWHNFLSTRPDIRLRILKYEPIQLEMLHEELKKIGFKYNIQDLLSFLDKKCITVRTNQNARKNKLASQKSSQTVKQD